MAKIKAESIGSTRVLPHKYRHRITFPLSADITPLLTELVPKVKDKLHPYSWDKKEEYSDLECSDPIYEDCVNDWLEYMDVTDSKKYYFKIRVSEHQKDSFTLFMGHNDMKKMAKVVEKHVTLK